MRVQSSSERVHSARLHRHLRKLTPAITLELREPQLCSISRQGIFKEFVRIIRCSCYWKVKIKLKNFTSLRSSDSCIL